VINHSTTCRRHGETPLVFIDILRYKSNLFKSGFKLAIAKSMPHRGSSAGPPAATTPFHHGIIDDMIVLEKIQG
jgi:hypothetical protein